MRQCHICQLFWDERGFTAHVQSCIENEERSLANMRAFQEHEAQLSIAHMSGIGLYPSQFTPSAAVSTDLQSYNMFTGPSNQHDVVPPEFDHVPVADHNPTGTHFGMQLGINDEFGIPSGIENEESPTGSTTGYATGANATVDEPIRTIPDADDLIKTEWHPFSGKPVEISSFEDYRATPIEKAPPVPIEDALGPFDTELDAEFCEWMLDANISASQGDKLINIVHRFVSAGQSPQVGSWKDWKKTMDAATALTTPFQRETFIMPYENQDLQHTVVYRDIVDDVLLVLDNPNLQPLLEIWARRTSKSNDGGKTWERFITQPWTGDIWWEIDDLFPGSHDLPIRILIYSDKTRLSSFGSVQGWPVYWRLLHLDSDIRNSRGIGGGRVAGFLPQLPEDQKYKSKPKEWADYKRKVYQRAYTIILAAVKRTATHGIARKLSYITDEVYWLFIIVMIISADLDEQTMFALTRAFNAIAPCTVCLVKKTELLHDGPFPPRTNKHAQELYEWATSGNVSKTEVEAAYKKYGMRFMENPMWTHLPHLDIFRALSVCIMHTNAGGNWPHIRGEMVDYVCDLAKKLGLPLVASTDAQMAVFPRWRNLNHFSHWLSNDLADATKHEDMSIQAMYCLHSVLTPEHKHGYLLLRTLRAYHEMNAYGGLTVHTETTIAAGLAAHSRYLAVLRRLEAQYPDDKAWGFPKSHTPLHLFADIVAKGAQIHFNTKPSEQMHSSIKATYQHRTNFKDVDVQLARYEAYFDAMLTIRHNIEMNRAATEALGEEYEDDVANVSQGPNPRKRQHDKDKPPAKKRRRRVDTSTQSPAVTIHAHVCDAGGKHSVEWMEAKDQFDRAYENFGANLDSFMQNYINQHWDGIAASGVAEPDAFAGFPPSAPIHRYAELRVTYSSEVDWAPHMDLLRCNPMFNGSVRYDCVLVDDPDGGQPFFARLVTVFRCFPYPGSTFSVVCALIQPYKQDLERSTLKSRLDKELRFYRVRSQPRKQAMFISVENIIRGALLVEDYLGQPPIDVASWRPDFARVKDYMVVDLVDEDMFIRMQTLEYAGRRPGIFSDRVAA